MSRDYLILFLIIGLTMFVTVRWKKLTIEAAVAGGVIGLLLFVGAGFTGVSLMATFFILGTAATSLQSKTKTSLGIAEEHGGQRTAAQVLANAGVAALLGIYIYLLPERTNIFQIMMAASFSAATSDTLSSELGNIYGSRYYNIMTFKKDRRGLNGVVSLEGTIAGIVGSAVIATVYAIGFGWHISFVWIVVAGTIGNLIDSILGATAERKHYLDNNAVNFLNTLTAAIVAMVLVQVF